MTQLPVLYSFRRCPYAMRARMALLISGQAVELREVVLRAKPQAMIDISAKATVPVLLLPSGQVIDQSIDIMRWALTHNDPENWLAGDDAGLIAANDGSFKHHLDRYKYPGRHDSDPIAHRDMGLALLQPLEERLGKQSQLCGGGRTLTDIALFPFIRQFAATNQNWFDAQPLPYLRHWLAGHVQSPLFERAMTRFAPWDEGAAPELL